jgi:hypothetical protein
MSQALIASMMEEGQIFDAEKMRLWLGTCRNVAAVPTIEPHQAILMR